MFRCLVSRHLKPIKPTGCGREGRVLFWGSGTFATLMQQWMCFSSQACRSPFSASGVYETGFLTKRSKNLLWWSKRQLRWGEVFPEQTHKIFYNSGVYHCYLTVDEPIRHRITALFQKCSIFEHATQHGLKIQTIKVSFQQRQPFPGLHLSSCLQRTWAGTLLCPALLRVDISVKVGQFHWKLDVNLVASWHLLFMFLL